MSRTAKLLHIPVFVFGLAFFSYFALHRFIDADEGFYLLASRLVLLHKRLYLDFFYQQAPLLPYAYGSWMKFAGVSWASARVFSAFLTALLAVLMYEHVCHETRQWMAGLAAVLLLASTTFVYAWFPIAKTFSLAILPLFGAYVLVARLSAASSGWLLAASGLLFALGVDGRSYLVALAPVFLWWILQESGWRKGIVRLLWFAGGFLLGITPSVYFFLAAPGVYLFDNLGFHAIRTTDGLIGEWRWKLHIARLVMTGSQDNGFQFTIVSLVAFVMLCLTRARRKASLLAFVFAVALAFVSILPTPPNTQYFSVCLPFLIVTAVCATHDYVASLRASSARWATALACLALLAGYVGLGTWGAQRYLITGDDVIGIRNTQDASNWTLAGVSQVSRAIDQLTAPNEAVASLWPGYLFQSHALPYPGLENDFGRLVSRKLSLAQRVNYHLISPDEIAIAFAAHQPRIAVVGNQGNAGGNVLAYRRALRASHYTLVQSVGDTFLYQCCSTP